MSRRLDVSVIPRTERFQTIRELRNCGFSNNYIRQFMEEAEEEKINKKLGILGSAKISDLEKLHFARPYIIAKMVREQHMNPRDAESTYDLGMEQTLQRLGALDDFGRETDEAYQAAYQATHQFVKGISDPRSQTRQERKVLFRDYIESAQAQA